MKTSNKIFFALVATIFLITTAAFIDVRVFGVHRSKVKVVKKTHNIELGNYRHLKLVNVPSLEIRPSSKNHLNFIAYKDTTEFNIDHRIENDTLFLVGVKKHYVHYSLYTQSIVESISSKDSKIELKGLKQASMNLKLDGGEVNCWSRDSTRVSRFENLKIDQINSRSYLRNIITDTLEIILTNSRANFVKGIKVVDAVANNKSNLELRNVSEVKFKKDKSSKVNFY